MPEDTEWKFRDANGEEDERNDDNGLDEKAWGYSFSKIAKANADAEVQEQPENYERVDGGQREHSEFGVVERGGLLEFVGRQGIAIGDLLLGGSARGCGGRRRLSERACTTERKNEE